jgi:hypothetical protein
MENCRHVEGPNPISEFFFLIKRGTFVRKPKLLNWRASYICTDSTTLKTLMLLLNQGHQRRITLSCHPVGRHLTARIEVNSVRGVDIAIVVSKSELSHILQGYPPWYRTTLYLANGTKAPHPITTFADISRGGWIAAIGLSRTRPLRSHCMVAEPLDGWSNYKKLVHVASAFDRILYRLDSLLTTFTENVVWIREALRLVTYLHDKTPITSGRGGGRISSHTYSVFQSSSFRETFGPQWFSGKELGESRKFVEGLSQEQCLMIMEVFAQYGMLTNEAVEGLRGCLLAALRAVLVGCWEVHVYTATSGKVVWESELEVEKIVWLRVGDRDGDEDEDED